MFGVAVRLPTVNGLKHNFLAFECSSIFRIHFHIDDNVSIGAFNVAIDNKQSIGGVCFYDREIT